MKKVFLVLALFGMLSAVAPAYATDVDGAWLASSAQDPILGLAMIRANGGQLASVLCGWNHGNMSSWGVFLGPFDGTNGQLSLVLTSQGNGLFPQSMTINYSLTSATTATGTVTSCADFPQLSNCPPVGTVFQLEKIF
jgi:hypothetical protein